MERGLVTLEFETPSRTTIVFKLVRVLRAVHVGHGHSGKAKVWANVGLHHLTFLEARVATDGLSPVQKIGVLTIDRYLLRHDDTARDRCGALRRRAIMAA
jgi:hypothetical protein